MGGMSVDIGKLRIVLYPHPVLREVAQPIVDTTDEVREVAKKMLELMREKDGVGLAAPQVGLNWRMFVTRDIPLTLDNTGDMVDGDEDGVVFINPELTIGQGVMGVREEGCLSLPDIHVDVRRPLRAEIRATGMDGESLSFVSEHFIARVWQHEFDHLNGVLIIDKMSPIDRLATRKALRELELSAGG